MSQQINHVAIIMDGNGRWAEKRRQPRIYGHRKGVANTETIIDCAIEEKIKYLSLFAFSTENWKRPQNEVSALMDILKRFLKNDVEKLIKKKVKLVISGDRKQFSPELNELLKNVETRSQDNRDIVVNIALNYSGRWDIVQAARRWAEACRKSESPLENIDEQAFASYLEHPEIPDPDLLIRTGNEMRVSNFFLWQLAYTELYISEKMWPDFMASDFKEALGAFAQRNRRFGGLKPV